ncbi:MAG: DUF3108 domain-containing protein [Thermodesulfovibrionales bacterium]|nr:DUF3108 domain-containing protein [Thermodesulfovibrionales bacterium]
MRNYKHKPGWIALSFLVLICIIRFSLPSQASYVAPFRVPEKFVYDLTWTGIKAGTASLESVNDGDKVRIISTARSADWISVFYTVEDRIESTLFREPEQTGIGHPHSYRIKIREGRHRRDKEVVFDRTANRATYIDHLKKERKEYTLPDPVFDPISSFFHVRLLRLVVGEPVYVTIFDSKKVWNVEVQVLRKEKVSLPVGTFDTIVIKPVLQSEGIFFRKGEIFIWLTDDAKHIPVKLQTKVAVGSITATLVQGTY